MDNDTVTVSASDLLWVLTEFGLLCLIADKFQEGLGSPPSMEAAFRLTEALPESVDLPAEAGPSARIASLIAMEAGL